MKRLLDIYLPVLSSAVLETFYSSHCLTVKVKLITHGLVNYLVLQGLITGNVKNHYAFRIQ